MGESRQCGREGRESDVGRMSGVCQVGQKEWKGRGIVCEKIEGVKVKSFQGIEQVVFQIFRESFIQVVRRFVIWIYFR